MISIEAYRVSIGSFLTKARVTSASSQQLLQQDYDYFAKRLQPQMTQIYFLKLFMFVVFILVKVKNPS